MIPAGYMAKWVSLRPEWLHAEQVVDIFSVSSCVSKDFADYRKYWKHNGYSFFDSAEIIQQLARENSINLEGTSLFYYEIYELEFDEEFDQWVHFKPELAFKTNVMAPPAKCLAGYDVVSFMLGVSAEHSPLSCNHWAAEIETNSHCLLPSLEQAKQIAESCTYENSEPGPYWIFAVYWLTWP